MGIKRSKPQRNEANGSNERHESGIVALKQLPFKHAKAIHLDDKFIIIPNYRKGKEDYNENAGIYSYDSKQNKWNIIMKYPMDLEMSCRAYSFDKYTSTLQLYSNDKDEIIKIFNINITTKQWDIIKTNNLRDDGVSMYTVINNELHIIGNSKHRIWNKYSQQITVIHSFDSRLVNIGFQSIKYLQNKNKLLVFGGFSEHLKQCSDEIYCYSILTQTWNKLNVKLPQKLHLMAVIATKDEKYVILLGGWGEQDNASLDSKDIYVYNVDKQIVFKSKVCLPTKGQYRAVICDNCNESLILTNGYIQKICIHIISIH